MRHALDTAWLHSKDNKFLGINLGADFCAEHEWGIKGLKSKFGITEDISVYGIDKRKIDKVPDDLYFLEEEKKSILITKDFWRGKPEVLTIEELKNSELRDAELSAAWDENSFGIYVNKKQNQKYLERIYKAFQNKDIAIWLGGRGIFANNGLCFGILSEIKNHAKEGVQVMYDADENLHKLQVASDETGIIQKIDEFNNVTKKGFFGKCGYFALSPVWKHGHKVNTKYPVVYWLNPQAQDKNNYGYFSVEQLEEWMEGKGPIPKKV